MKIYIEPNARGGWSLRWDYESSLEAVGNYATPADAARIARHNFADVEIVAPSEQAAGVPAVRQQSTASRLAELGVDISRPTTAAGVGR